MKKYKWVIIFINLIILLGLFTKSVIEKETILAEGQLILLKLAPVDPRSLMQGDYMRLRYDISNNTNHDSIAKRGFCIVKLEPNGVGQKVRLQERINPIVVNEFPIEYTINQNRGINIGAESFFFQEGEAMKYDSAQYGGIKVDDDGNSLLIGLYDKNLELIK